VDDGVELRADTCREVVAAALVLGQVDHPDRAFQQRLVEQLPQPVAFRR
jgi:hypothetical protein